MARISLVPFVTTLLVGVASICSCSDHSSSHTPSGAADTETGSDATADAEGDLAEPVDVAVDTSDLDGPADVLADLPDGDSGEPASPSYLRTYEDAAAFPAPAGYQWRRAIIHLHSTHSHDACDDTPRIDGEPNWQCIEDLREGLCRTRVDVAYLTDHRELMAETAFEDLVLYDPARDRPIRDGGVTVGNQLGCPDGWSVLVSAGLEGSQRLTLLDLPGHVSPDLEDREALYARSDNEAIETFREHGAIIWGAHTEGAEPGEILARGLDGIEVYQLHANLDPQIRQEDLGLPPFEGLEPLFEIQMGRTAAHPDLSLLAFLEPNEPALAHWAQALESGPMVGSGATDAHRNVLPLAASDGERFDSYRRTFAWFSNYLLAEDTSLAAADRALRAGRLMIAFDTLASPSGFDLALVTTGGERFEMGSTSTFEPNVALELTVPEIRDGDGDLVPIRAELLREEEGGWIDEVEVGAGHHRIPLEGPGIYRVEVWMRPRHLAPYLDDLADLAEREVIWIYSNAFRVLGP